MGVDRSKCIQLLLGTAGIYFTYLAIGLIQEWLLKYPYKNIINGDNDIFTSTISLVLFPHLATYIVGSIYNKYKIPQDQKTSIPSKNSMMCAFLVLLGGVTFNYAIKWTSYPVVITAKSCNILSVILVGTLCSRVTDKKLKLSPSKIITGIAVSIGILLFKWFDPQTKANKEQKNFQIIGFLVLIVSMLADGFLPDFQAQIKSKHNPKPTQMMVKINQWVVIYSVVYVMLAGDSLTTFKFALTHQLFALHLIALSLLVCCGHFIIYRMIRTFKQHIVPFVITTRKVFTVCISLVFYNHKTHIGQILGIVIVLVVVIVEFMNELKYEDTKSKKGERIQGQKFEQIEIEMETQVEIHPQDQKDFIKAVQIQITNHEDNEHN